MIFIWFGFFIEILILALIKPIIIDFETEAIMAVSLHAIFSMLILMSYKSKQKVIYLGALIARIFLLFWDLFARYIYVLPNSGADSEMYYENSITIANELSLLSKMEGLRGGIYSQINGLLFHFIGSQRLVGQYINVLLGLSIVFIVNKILLMLDVNPKICMYIVIITAFFPNSMVMSAIFLREIFPTFFVTASAYFFISWFNKPRYKYMILSLIMLSIASIFHSGVIGISIGYAFTFLFYKSENKVLKFSSRTIVTFVMIVVTASLAFTSFEDLLLGKFKNMENINDIYTTANSRLGGSAYLTGLTINNPLQLAIYGPVKSFFFLTSPLPMNWRGFMDIFTFLSDSMLYLGIIVYCIKNRKKFDDRRTLIICLVIMILGASFIFGIGVGNAGTAVRHRQKLTPLFLVLLGLMMDGKKKTALK